MAYRDDATALCEAPTAEGPLRVEVAARAVTLRVAKRTVHVADKTVTILEHKKRTSIAIAGRLITARDVPHEDLGLWIELPGGMRRIFGVEPVSLLEPSGLPALAALDRLAHRLRHALADHAGDIRRAIEIGRGLDKVLLADQGDRYVVYARPLFRDRARFAMTIFDDGRIVIGNGTRKPREIVVRSRFAITVTGDYVRFAAPTGEDIARIAIPWIALEDRQELARRIGQLVDRADAPMRV